MLTPTELSTELIGDPKVRVVVCQGGGWGNVGGEEGRAASSFGSSTNQHEIREGVAALQITVGFMRELAGAVWNHRRSWG